MKANTKRPAPGGAARTQEKEGPQSAAGAAQQPEKSLKQHFHEGLAAALKTHPDALHSSRPRTVLGEIVRQLAIRAGNGQCDAIRMVAHLLDVSAEAEWNKTGTDSGTPGQSNGERRWDWTADGKWDCPKHPTVDAAGEAGAGSPPLWEQLYARVVRTADSEREEEARKARLMGGAAPAEPVSGSFAGAQFPASGNFSGNSDPAPALSVRIAGKEV